MRREPQEDGHQRSRWTLALILKACETWRVKSVAGMGQLLQRFGIHWRRARTYVHSPDPAYDAKRKAIQALHTQVQACYPETVLLYLDECTYERQPTRAHAFAPARTDLPRARGAHGPHYQHRILATLDAMTGQVVAHQARTISVPTLRSFYRRLCDAYPHSKRLYIVQDNWPVHFHPHLLASLEPQTTPFPLFVPPSWANLPPVKPPPALLPIQIIPLPTYASWCNPIEKLWRKLRQDLLHLHPFASHWSLLHARVSDFLLQFANGSLDLLRYVGLFPLRY